MSRIIELAPGAEVNGFASMLATLIRQNIDDHASKAETFDRTTGRVAIVVEDLALAVTLLFGGGRLTLFDGIAGIPDVTLRADSELILKSSLIELLPRVGLPDPRGVVSRELGRAALDGSFRSHGGVTQLPLMVRLTRLLSVN